MGEGGRRGTQFEPTNWYGEIRFLKVHHGFSSEKL